MMTLTYSYDENLNVKVEQRTQPLNSEKLHAYDALDRLVSVFAAAGLAKADLWSSDLVVSATANGLVLDAGVGAPGGLTGELRYATDLFDRDYLVERPLLAGNRVDPRKW